MGLVMVRSHWNSKTGACIRTFNGHVDSVLSVSFDKEGILASGSCDRMINYD